MINRRDTHEDKWIKDLVYLWPKRLWIWNPWARPRIHFCGFWGECKNYGAAPNIAIMGVGHHWMLYFPSSRNTPYFHLRHSYNEKFALNAGTAPTFNATKETKKQEDDKQQEE